MLRLWLRFKFLEPIQVDDFSTAAIDFQFQQQALKVFETILAENEENPIMREKLYKLLKRLVASIDRQY
jgi:hypothetical protein